MAVYVISLQRENQLACSKYILYKYMYVYMYT